MKTQLALALIAALLLCCAAAEAINPYAETAVGITAETAEGPIACGGVDFGAGASVLRFNTIFLLKPYIFGRLFRSGFASLRST